MYASHFGVSRQQSYTRSTALPPDLNAEPEVGPSGPEQYGSGYYYGQPTGFAASGSPCASSVAYAATMHDPPCVPALDAGLQNWNTPLSQPFQDSFGGGYAASNLAHLYGYSTAPAPSYVQAQASSYASDLQLHYPYDSFAANPAAYAGSPWESPTQLLPPMSSMADLPSSSSRHTTGYHEVPELYKAGGRGSMMSNGRRLTVVSPRPRPAYRPPPPSAGHSRVPTPSEMAVQYSRKPSGPASPKSKTVTTLKRKAHEIDHIALPPTPPPRERRHACTMCYKRFDRPSTLKKHILVHTGEKAFECTCCQRRFSVASNLNRHMKKCILKQPTLPYGQAPNSLPVETSCGALAVRASSHSPPPPISRRSVAAAVPTPPPPPPPPPPHSSKRIRRAPSPTRFIPDSLRDFTLQTVESAGTCAIPAPPVRPGDAIPLPDAEEQLVDVCPITEAMFALLSLRCEEDPTPPPPDVAPKAAKRPLPVPCTTREEDRDSYNENVHPYPYSREGWARKLPGPSMGLMGKGIGQLYRTASSAWDEMTSVFKANAAVPDPTVT
ncbi:hypothetical protein BD626DRAFT_403980 [Schizophyllum amplum]|uniref:C2H2-type domain-containing protein n=1 Tax=Schizophyllum amplum TaxID=97359 RepID=A0A550CD87_9AGAR|nr:hypothetical protein BD626DRAFT_403980 [Auriculariopsis ampla]